MADGSDPRFVPVHLQHEALESLIVDINGNEMLFVLSLEVTS